VKRSPTISIDGLPILRRNRLEVAQLIATSAQNGIGGVVATVNLQFLALARRNRPFKKMLLSCDYLVADGMPLVWASHIARDPLPGRVDGVGLVADTIAAAHRDGLSCYLIGGHPGTADAAAANWQQTYAGLRIVGVSCPPMGFDGNPALLQKEIDAIAAAAPNIVLVGFGCPRQEQFSIACHRALPKAWFIGVGGSFDFAARLTIRAPHVLQKMGFEWLHRLVHEPRRLAHRYLVECLPVGVSILLRATYQRRRRAT
jgi:N-acetylglucosaminyldiphosphoundecaprenol N-acetyl-beta-D-mannosaminyltransferase